MSWKQIFKDSATFEEVQARAEGSFKTYGVYPKSLQKKDRTIFFIARVEQIKALVLYGSREYFDSFSGEEHTVDGLDAKVCALNHENCEQIRALFPYTRPISHGDREFSLGLGDRLGVASAGHIRLIKGLDVFPILAQQSMRELNLTNRIYPGVLDDASWAVFQESYTTGFGADADHLKTKEEVQNGLDCGYTMITLDCSEHIANQYFDMDEAQLANEYSKLPEAVRIVEQQYLGGAIKVGESTSVEFSKAELMRCILVYRQALDFMNMIYCDVISKSPYKVDFEVSIDETTVPTTPEAHYFIASELKKRNVHFESLAPRFCGEFQKGIDYIGDPKSFEKEFIIHADIARHFGYRLSIHSGSDKFSVFPVIGKYTQLKVHVKTAGTNWLEAVRLIAEKNPSLYRRMHRFALEHLGEAKKYYHISAEPEKIKDLDMLDDSDLSGLMDLNESRQVLHITYGLLLQEKDSDGRYTFRDDIYRTLSEYEEDYYENLRKHIGKHLKKLGIL